MNEQMRDPLGAFVPGTDIRIEGAAEGPLAGASFAAKDIYDIAGAITGCGNPDWARTHEPAQAHAVAVQALLDAGATLVGKAITDELAYSLNGKNHHYGTPTNSNAPGRIPGGSSCGSERRTSWHAATRATTGNPARRDGRSHPPGASRCMPTIRRGR